MPMMGFGRIGTLHPPGRRAKLVLGGRGARCWRFAGAAGGQERAVGGRLEAGRAGGRGPAAGQDAPAGRGGTGRGRRRPSAGELPGAAERPAAARQPVADEQPGRMNGPLRMSGRARVRDRMIRGGRVMRDGRVVRGAPASTARILAIDRFSGLSAVSTVAPFWRFARMRTLGVGAISGLSLKSRSGQAAMCCVR